MSTETSVLGLTLPELADRFKLDDWNGNMEKIDEYAANVNAELLSMGGSVGSLTTALTAETTARQKDAAGLADLIDAGAKNILNWTAPGSLATITFTDNGDGTFTISGQPTNTTSIKLAEIYGHTGEKLVLTGCPAGGSQTSGYSLLIADNNGSMIGPDEGNGYAFTVPNIPHFRVYARFRPGTYSNLLFKPMVCLQSALAVSDKFVPYCPSLQDLWAMVKALQ